MPEKNVSGSNSIGFHKAIVQTDKHSGENEDGNFPKAVLNIKLKHQVLISKRVFLNSKLVTIRLQYLITRILYF